MLVGVCVLSRPNQEYHRVGIGMAWTLHYMKYITNLRASNLVKLLTYIIIISSHFLSKNMHVNQLYMSEPQISNYIIFVNLSFLLFSGANSGLPQPFSLV